MDEEKHDLYMDIGEEVRQVKVHGRGVRYVRGHRGGSQIVQRSWGRRSVTSRCKFVGEEVRLVKGHRGGGQVGQRSWRERSKIIGRSGRSKVITVKSLMLIDFLQCPIHAGMCAWCKILQQHERCHYSLLPVCGAWYVFYCVRFVVKLKRLVAIHHVCVPSYSVYRIILCMYGDTERVYLVSNAECELYSCHLQCFFSFH